MLVDFSFSFLIGIIGGVIAGMLPGVGPFAFLLLFYPLLVQMDPVYIVCSYAVAVGISQYFGSVSSILFGIPGEASSLPALKEGHSLYQQGEGGPAIMMTAVGSFLGSNISVLFTLALASLLWVFVQIFSADVQGVIILFALFGIFIVSDNKLWINALMIIGGLVLGHIGLNAYTRTPFLSFDFIPLYSGLPFLPVVIVLYVMPILIKGFQLSKSIKAVKVSPRGYYRSFQKMIHYRWTLTRSIVIGFLSGFIPGVTYTLGTNVGYAVEKWFEEKKKTYNTGNMACLISAETANNAGAYSQLLPLLIFGIPVTASEAFLYDMIEMKSLITLEFLQEMVVLVSIAVVLANIIGILLAGRFVNLVSWIGALNNKILYSLLTLIMIGITIYTGFSMNQQTIYILSLVFLLPLGILLRELDTLPLIFAFILHDRVESTIRQLIAIHTEITLPF